jgi:hypothetical protein
MFAIPTIPFCDFAETDGAWEKEEPDIRAHPPASPFPAVANGHLALRHITLYGPRSSGAVEHGSAY